MATTEKKTRKPRTNYQAQHDRLVMWCQLSIDILEAVLSIDVINENITGQITALKAVLKQLGVKEAE